MLKRTMAVVFALVLAMTATSALAQTCVIGVYADDAGTTHVFQPTQNEEFNVYVVIFVEDLVSAASYGIDIPGLYTEVFLMDTTFGPTGDGLNFFSTNGYYQVGLGECTIGFTGLPVLVATYTLLMPFETTAERTITVGPNMDANPLAPEYSTCQGVIKSCDVGPGLLVEGVVANDSESWGAVKALY